MSTFDSSNMMEASHYSQISSFDIIDETNVGSDNNFAAGRNNNGSSSIMNFYNVSSYEKKKKLRLGLVVLAFLVMAIVALKPSSSTTPSSSSNNNNGYNTHHTGSEASLSESSSMHPDHPLSTTYESPPTPPSSAGEDAPPSTVAGEEEEQSYNTDLKDMLKNSNAKDIKNMFKAVHTEVVQEILEEYFPDVPSSPEQQKALEWLVRINADSAKTVFKKDEALKKNKFGLVQRFVISVFYASTGGDDWNDVDQWHMRNIHKRVCDWAGIECDANGNIKELWKVNDNLHGKIPSELGVLKGLETLVLSSNNLTGTLPTELGNLFNLVRLDLYDNNLTGSVPSELIPLLDSNVDCEIGRNPELKGIPRNCIAYTEGN